MAIKKIIRSTEEKLYLKSRIAEVEESVSAIYFLKHDEDIVYVGSTVNLKTRIATHLSQRFKLFNDFSFILCDDESLIEREKEFIFDISPKYNKNHCSYGGMKAKDDVIRLRVKTKDKELLKEAAIIEEVSLSSFMLEAGIDKAKRIIKKSKESK